MTYIPKRQDKFGKPRTLSTDEIRERSVRPNAGLEGESESHEPKWNYVPQNLGMVELNLNNGISIDGASDPKTCVITFTLPDGLAIECKIEGGRLVLSCEDEMAVSAVLENGDPNSSLKRLWIRRLPKGSYITHPTPPPSPQVLEWP